MLFGASIELWAPAFRQTSCDENLPVVNFQVLYDPLECRRPHPGDQRRTCSVNTVPSDGVALRSLFGPYCDCQRLAQGRDWHRAALEPEWIKAKRVKAETGCHSSGEFQVNSHQAMIKRATIQEIHCALESLALKRAESARPRAMVRACSAPSVGVLFEQLGFKLKKASFSNNSLFQGRAKLERLASEFHRQFFSNQKVA